MKTKPETFALRTTEIDPEVIGIRKNTSNHTTPYCKQHLKGRWHRVVPTCWRDIKALRLLDHHVDKFAPFEGNGVIISHEALLKFHQ